VLAANVCMDTSPMTPNIPGRFAALRRWVAASPRLRKAGVLLALAVVLAWTSLPGALRFGRDPTVSTLDAMHLATLQGDPARLADAAGGRPLVVNLWASWCAPCVIEMPLLAARQRERPDIGFVFANQGEDIFTARHYVEASALALALDHVLLDPGKAIGTAIGSRALPITLFFDAAGHLVDTHVGVLTPASLGAALKRIAPVPPTASR
ncbi:MAG: TlpA disulfide reductase family protein, partial [Caldimonas sp.]